MRLDDFDYDLPDDHKDYGLATYNYHRDGSGVAYSSHLRPLLTWRPDFMTFFDEAGSGLRHLPADMPVADMFWGDRYGQVEDPFGHRWSVATHIRDMTPEQMQEEMKKAMNAMCGDAAKTPA